MRGGLITVGVLLAVSGLLLVAISWASDFYDRSPVRATWIAILTLAGLLFAVTFCVLHYGFPTY
jgi:hypothetical protein